MVHAIVEIKSLFVSRFECQGNIDIRMLCAPYFALTAACSHTDDYDDSCMVLHAVQPGVHCWLLLHLDG